MATLGEELAADLADAIGIYEQSFTWNGTGYACVINAGTSILTTSKALFPGAVYPKVGNTIVVAGKNRQVKKVGKAGFEAKAGGYVEDKPFVDDPSAPGLDIEFGTFAG